MGFCSPSYFPANDCCFACVSFHILVFPFSPALPSFSRTSHFVPRFPSQNPVEHTRSRCLLQRTSFYIPIDFPPMNFFFFLNFLIPDFSSFSCSLCLSRSFLSKILLSMPAPGPSSSVLPSLYPFLPYFPVLCGF